MKKLLLPLLLCGLVALLFCACTTTPPPDETLPDTTAPVTEAPTDPATEPPTEEPTETPTEETTEAPTEEPTEEVTTDYFEANAIETVAPDTAKDVHMVISGEGYDVYRLPDNGNGG
jgi:cytoskeletal protein RodZ